MNLNAKTVNDLVLPDGETDCIWWDDELTGFGYRQRRRRSGSRVGESWLVQARIHGRTRRIKLGSRATLTAAKARNAAREVLARIALGADPAAEKQNQRQEAKRSVRATVAKYLEAREGALRPASMRVTKLYLTGTYFQDLHALSVNDVTRSTVAPCLRAIERKHSTATAAAARRALSAFYAWCIAEGLLGDGSNPVDGSHRPADPKARDRVLGSAELVAIWKACDEDDFSRIVRLLILTGTRRQEVGGLRWSELNPDADTWTLPEGRAKNGYSVTLPMSPAALALIGTRKDPDRDHVFGNRSGAGFTNWAQGKTELDRRLGGTVRSWRLHDIRRTVVTGMGDIGIFPHVVETIVNHRGGFKRGVAGTYNKSQYEQEVKTAMLRWSDHVLALVEGRAGKIVSLRA